MLLTAVISGVALGFLSSAHCIGMCGPLLISLPHSPSSIWTQFWRKLSYHLSRSWVYGIMGLAVGWFGKGLEKLLPHNFHAWISVVSGILLVVGYYTWPHFKFGNVGTRVLQTLGSLGRHPHWAAEITMGMLNALLPCGMVYVALTMALGQGSPLAAFVLMLSFGLGTTPAMLGCSLLGGRINFRRAFSKVPIKSIAVLTCSGLLIIRGLGLGIPYISPSQGVFSQTEEQPSCCPKKH